MRKSILAAGLIGLGGVAALGSAFAQSSLTVHPRRGIPLPSYVTSSDNWLNPGNVPTPGEAARSDNYARLVEDPIGNIVPVGPDLGPVPWQ
ncbi:MAG TPA: hypothetical protein VMU18_08260 [Rhodoblastus sp.]|nr:hypothetical protein [Rhodoblastus sp.]